MAQVTYEFIGVAGVGTLLCLIIGIVWCLLGDSDDGWGD